MKICAHPEAAFVCRLAVSLLALSCVAVACEQSRSEARAETPAAGRAGAVVLRNIPHVLQRPDFCGEACAEMALRALGHSATQDDIFGLTGVDPLEGRGAYAPELVEALQRLGFDPGPVWFPATEAETTRALMAQWRELRADLKRGVPSIVCMVTRSGTEHFRLVVGHDPADDAVLYHEPAEEDGAFRRMPLPRFLAQWRLLGQTEGRTIIRMRLLPTTIQLPPKSGPFSRAAFAQHIRALKERHSMGRFNLALAPPFVVIGDESADKVQRYADDIVRWAVTRLGAKLFDKSPQTIHDIWLFGDAPSYRRNTKALFGIDPDTPYGFSSRAHRALVMDISTGGGTLVHEIVHPFVAADFPGCPAWLNEGLGSLYEQSGEVNGEIWGFPNWRLPRLQKAIRAGRPPLLKELTSLSDDAFYADDSGLHYAAARYLCLYLQEHGLLTDFYRRFRANRTGDPTGWNSLLHVLKASDATDIDTPWRRFVLNLAAP